MIRVVLAGGGGLYTNEWGRRQGNGPTFQPTDRPTESDRKRPRHPTERVLQRDDSAGPLEGGGVRI